MMIYAAGSTSPRGVAGLSRPWSARTIRAMAVARGFVKEARSKTVSRVAAAAPGSRDKAPAAPSHRSSPLTPTRATAAVKTPWLTPASRSSHHDHQDYCQHHRILRDVLPFIRPPESAENVAHVRFLPQNQAPARGSRLMQCNCACIRASARQIVLLDSSIGCVGKRGCSQVPRP